MLPIYNNSSAYNDEEISYFFKYASEIKMLLIVHAAASMLTGFYISSYSYVIPAGLIIGNILLVAAAIFSYRVRPNINKILYKKNYNNSKNNLFILPDEEEVFSPADGVISSIEIIDENHIKYNIKPRPILDSQVQIIPLSGKVCSVNSGRFYKNTIIKTLLGEVEIRQECFSKILNLFYYDCRHIINFFDNKSSNKMVTSGRPLGLVPLPFYILNAAEFSIILPLRAAERGCLGSNNKYKNQLSFHNKISVGTVVRAGETIIGAYLIGSIIN